jgi:hypothetical protein
VEPQRSGGPPLSGAAYLIRRQGEELPMDYSQDRSFCRWGFRNAEQFILRWLLIFAKTKALISAKRKLS